MGKNKPKHEYKMTSVTAAGNQNHCILHSSIPTGVSSDRLLLNNSSTIMNKIIEVKNTELIQINKVCDLIHNSNEYNGYDFISDCMAFLDFITNKFSQYSNGIVSTVKNSKDCFKRDNQGNVVLGDDYAPLINKEGIDKSEKVIININDINTYKNIKEITPYGELQSLNTDKFLNTLIFLKQSGMKDVDIKNYIYKLAAIKRSTLGLVSDSSFLTKSTINDMLRVTYFDPSKDSKNPQDCQLPPSDLAMLLSIMTQKNIFIYGSIGTAEHQFRGNASLIAYKNIEEYLKSKPQYEEISSNKINIPEDVADKSSYILEFGITNSDISIVNENGVHFDRLARNDEKNNEAIFKKSQEAIQNIENHELTKIQIKDVAMNDFLKLESTEKEKESSTNLQYEIKLYNENIGNSQDTDDLTTKVNKVLTSFNTEEQKTLNAMMDAMIEFSSIHKANIAQIKNTYNYAINQYEKDNQDIDDTFSDDSDHDIEDFTENARFGFSQMLKHEEFLAIIAKKLGKSLDVKAIKKMRSLSARVQEACLKNGLGTETGKTFLASFKEGEEVDEKNIITADDQKFVKKEMGMNSFRFAKLKSFISKKEALKNPNYTSQIKQLNKTL